MYRSRLQRTEEKKNLRLAVWLVIGSIVLVLAMVIWGVPFLVKLAVLIGDLNSSRRPVDKNDLIPPAPPRLSAIYTATNSAVQTIYGSTEQGVTIYLTQNDNSVGTIVAKEDGTFQFNQVTLESGSNKFSAVAMDAAGNSSQPSQQLQITYSNKEPKLEVETPTDRQEFVGKDASIEIKGQTDPESRILLNDRVVLVGGDGRFSTRITLNEGENTLVIIAMDRAGNAARKELVVVYKRQ